MFFNSLSATFQVILIRCLLRIQYLRENSEKVTHQSGTKAMVVSEWLIVREDVRRIGGVCLRWDLLCGVIDFAGFIWYKYGCMVERRTEGESGT